MPLRTVLPHGSPAAGETPDSGAFQVAFRVILLFQAALIAPVLVSAPPIADLLFGDEFAKSAEVLRWLAPFVFLSGLAALVSLGANYLGLARRRVPIAIAAVLINIVVDLALIPTVGVIGAAIGTSLAYTIYVPGHVWLCWRWLDLRAAGYCLVGDPRACRRRDDGRGALPVRHRRAEPLGLARRRRRRNSDVRDDALAHGRAVPSGCRDSAPRGSAAECA